MQEKAQHVMTKIVNLLSAKAEMGFPMICMYLLGNPDHYTSGGTSHTFVPFYWQLFVTQVRQDFLMKCKKLPLLKKKEIFFGLSPVYDNIY